MEENKKRPLENKEETEMAKKAKPGDSRILVHYHGEDAGNDGGWALYWKSVLEKELVDVEEDRKQVKKTAWETLMKAYETDDCWMAEDLYNWTFYVRHDKPICIEKAKVYGGGCKNVDEFFSLIIYE